MRFLRAWWGQIVGGAAIAVVAPAAMLVAALTVGAAGGGLRNFGSLTQALTGPRVPAVEPAAARGAGGDGRRLLERSMPPDRARAARSSARRAGRPTAEVRDPASRGRDDHGRAPSPDAPPRAPVARPPAPDPAPPPEPEPGPVRRVGDRLEKVAREVPVAGEPASDVVGTIVDTVESMPPPGWPSLP